MRREEQEAASKPNSTHRFGACSFVSVKTIMSESRVMGVSRTLGLAAGQQKLRFICMQNEFESISWFVFNL
jgi:hypothetical protein